MDRASGSHLHCPTHPTSYFAFLGVQPPQSDTSEHGVIRFSNAIGLLDLTGITIFLTPLIL
jgi:hypothetical protein